MNRKVFFSFALILVVCLLLGPLSEVVQTQVTTKAQIAFDSDRDGNHEIYVMDADGSNLKRLTNHPADDTFHPGLILLCFLFSLLASIRLVGKNQSHVLNRSVILFSDPSLTVSKNGLKLPLTQSQ